MTLKPNQFRIIAGRWRSRRFAIADHAAVRPSPERVRETLFNWLMHDIHGAVCLDAFAGTGALGLEALSRGAQKVYFVEQEKTVFDVLREHVKQLAVENAMLCHASMPQVLSQFSEKFSIVFLDPPFKKNLVLPLLEALQKNNCLQEKALVYVETEAELDLLSVLSEDWEILKSSKAGQVKFYLLQITN